uniref:Uncharacterized protein n=1 Tax=Eutreptiella gymnastica TaxID=73025 RepID=A0A7S4CZZ3_9EUGL
MQHKDYLQYKKTIERHCAELPKGLQCPLMYEAHRWGVSRFAWSIMTVANATEILQLLFKQRSFDMIVSMGAGAGYVEHTFRQAAQELEQPLQVLAFDDNPPRNCHVEVSKGSPSAIATLGDQSGSILLLCWPPFGDAHTTSTMASDATTAFVAQGGKYMIYIGDVHATGDCKFHELLWSNWELYPETQWFQPLEVWVPESMGLLYGGYDSIGVYKLRDKPLPPPSTTSTS